MKRTSIVSNILKLNICFGGEGSSRVKLNVLLFDYQL